MKLEEINKRLSELEGLIEKETDPAKIKEYGTEVRSLFEERGKISGSELEIERSNARAAFEKAKGAEHLHSSSEKMSKRSALALLFGLNARGKMPNDEQKRALGVALTTTATSYVAATSEVNGVNNAGVLIPTKQFVDFLKEEGKLSPILADIAFSHVKGLMVFPYRKTRDAAKVKAEGSAPGKNQFEMASLSLYKGVLQVTIDVTDEVMSLTDIDLGAYVMENLVNDLSEDWANELIYGSGATNHVKGITNGATTTGINAYSKALEAVVAGIKLCKGKFRRGAKVYMAQDVYDAIAFALDDTGKFITPAINNQGGVSSVGPLRVEVDENLTEGDFVIGNVSKFYKANYLSDVSLEKQKDISSGITTFVSKAYIAAAPFPGAFILGSKA